MCSADAARGKEASLGGHYIFSIKVGAEGVVVVLVLVLAWLRRGERYT